MLTKYGIDTGANFGSPVHNHKMPGFFYDKCWFYIFYRKHVVIITMNMKYIGVLPVIFPVDCLVYCPGGVR